MPCSAGAAACGHGLLRLRNCFASLGSYSAQDDRFCESTARRNATLVSGDALPQRKGDCGGPRWRNRRRDPKRILGNATRKNIDRRRQTNPTSVILSEAGFALARGLRVEGPHACRRRREHRKAFSQCFVQSWVGTPCSARAAASGHGILRLRNCFASRRSYSAQDDRGYERASLQRLHRRQPNRNAIYRHDRQSRPARLAAQGWRDQRIRQQVSL